MRELRPKTGCEVVLVRGSLASYNGDALSQTQMGNSPSVVQRSTHAARAVAGLGFLANMPGSAKGDAYIVQYSRQLTWTDKARGLLATMLQLFPSSRRVRGKMVPCCVTPRALP